MAKEDGAPLTPQDIQYAAAGAQKAKHSIAYIVVAIFLLLNVIVLYILHFVDNGASHAANVAGEFKSGDLSSTSTSAKKGLAVSYGADGKLRVGAGTTAYLDAAALSDTDKLSYFQFAPLGTSQSTYKTNVIAYQHGTAPSVSSVVSTITVDAEAKSLDIAKADDKNSIAGENVRGLITLSDSTAIVLTTVPTGSNAGAYVRPVTISGSSVTVQNDKKVLASNASATNYIAPLSDSTFVTSFYEPYSATSDYYLRVKVGTIKSGAITYSDDLKFGDANTATTMVTMGQPFKVLKDGQRFTVPWYAAASFVSPNSTAAPSKGLCISTFSFDSGKVSASADVCNAKYAPTYYVESTKVSDNVLALAFVDTNNKNALTVVTVEFSTITYAPTFRSAYVVEEATGSFDFGSAEFGFYPKPSLKVLSDNRIAVSFFNPSNTGKPSVKVFTYSTDLSLSPSSPVLPIANADFTLATTDAKALGSVIINTLPVTSGIIVGYGGLWAGKQFQRVSYVESFGDPVGVITDDGSSLNVAMAGTASVDASLQAGHAYYAATSGKLYSPSTTSSDKYVLVNADKIVIARSSLVGVAVSGSKLFVSAQAN